MALKHREFWWQILLCDAFLRWHLEKLAFSQHCGCKNRTKMLWYKWPTDGHDSEIRNFIVSFPFKDRIGGLVRLQSFEIVGWDCVFDESSRLCAKVALESWKQATFKRMQLSVVKILKSFSFKMNFYKLEAIHLWITQREVLLPGKFEFLDWNFWCIDAPKTRRPDTSEFILNIRFSEGS